MKYIFVLFIIFWYFFAKSEPFCVDISIANHFHISYETFHRNFALFREILKGDFVISLSLSPTTSKKRKRRNLVWSYEYDGQDDI